jgi:hypothetical protein
MDATATITPTHRNLKAAALKRWQDWAAALADNGPPPPPLEVLEAGAMLAIESPMAALEADAAAIVRVRDLEAAAARTRAAIAERLANDGGPAGVRERLAAAKAEVRRLEKLVGMDPRSLAAGRADHEAATIRRDHPRAFNATKKQGPQAAGRSKS